MNSIPRKRHNIFASSSSSEAMVLTVVEQMTTAKKTRIKPTLQLKPDESIGNRDILLVEDSPTMKDFYRKMLEQNSYSVCTSTEDELAVDVAANNKPRLVLIDDAGTPHRIIRITRRLRQDARTGNIPILLMLPTDIYKKTHRRIKPFVDMCIPKTFTSAILLSGIQSLLLS
jgi:DNA-binding response OmpR family regulator